MTSKPTLLAWACMLALGCSVTAWSQPVPIQSGPTPPADAIAIPPGSKELAVKNLPAIVENIMKRSHVPGVAVAVVVDGKMVFAQGYGKRELGKNAPVDAQTVFQIASISKSLSATVAAMEVSKGTVAWSDPVVRYLPDFTLSNAYVSAQATIGDFFAHRSGLPGTAGDDLEDLGFTKADVIRRLRILPLDAFRTSYHYANFSTTIGAEAVAAAAGRPWEGLADDMLFKPLGMNATSYRYRDYTTRENRAALHVYQKGNFLPLGQRDADQQSPAGGVSSNVVDLAQWLTLLLADGQYQGKQLIASDALLPALSPQAFSARAHGLDSRTGFYGYGFNVNTELGGRPSMGHSGAFLLGAGTSFKIVPSAGIGIVVLTNGAPIGAAESITAEFIDTALYGKPTRDWFAAYNGAMMGFFQPQADLSAQSKPADPAPAKPLRQYAGRFDNAYFGSAEIKEENGALALVLGPKGMRFPLRHWTGDTFAFAPAGEAELVDSLASIAFTFDRDEARSFTIKFYDDSGLGQWSKK